MSDENTKTKEIQIDLGISEQADSTVTFLENGDPQAFKAVKNYLSLVFNNLKAFDITDHEVTYNQVFEKTNQMLPLRDEVVKVITSIARFEEHLKFYNELHTFFENLLLYFTFRDEGDSRNQLAADHFKAFGSELFLYTVAVLLKYRKFEQLNELTSQGYYSPRLLRGRYDKFISFHEFNRFPEAIAGYYGNKKVREERHKPTFLKERVFDGEISYDDLAQADFILHFISLLDRRTIGEYFYDTWDNQVLTETYPFELFVRSESARFFEKFAKCLRRVSKQEIDDFFKLYNEKIRESGVYYISLAWDRKIALNKIATRP